MKSKIAKISVSGICLLLWVGVCSGLGWFGTTAQNFVLTVLPFYLKFFIILLGGVMAIILPFRISSALERNRERQDDALKEAKLQAIAENQKRLDTKIRQGLRQTDEFNRYE